MGVLPATPVLLPKKASAKTMSYYYIPDEAGNPVPTDLETWSAWFERNDHHLAEDTLTHGALAATVSTIFLGIGLGHSRTRPLLYETIVHINVPAVLEGEMPDDHTFIDSSQRRYNTKEEALAGHAEAIEIVQHIFNSLPEVEARKLLLSGLEGVA